MSKRISRLLDQPERLVAKAIGKLEDKNGYPSHDVRLVASSHQKIRQKISELGLDADDTTGEELYHALLAKFENDSRQFRQTLSQNGDTFDEKSEAAKKIIYKNMRMPECWGLKSSAAKGILRQHPPKRLMKHLGFRSVDSLLKRQSLNEIYLVIPYVESASWQKQHNKLLARLDSAAFEPERLSLCLLPAEKWTGFDGPESLVAKDLTLGAIGLWPSKALAEAPILTMVLLVLETLSNFKPFSLSKIAARIDPVVAWWADMDHLIADQNSGHVSMNVMDVSRNHLHGHAFEDRLLDKAKLSFWEELLSRYENQTESAHQLMMDRVNNEIGNLKIPYERPAFEYAEESEGV